MVVALLVFLLGVVVEKAQGVLLEVLDALCNLSQCQLLERTTVVALSATNCSIISTLLEVDALVFDWQGMALLVDPGKVEEPFCLLY